MWEFCNWRLSRRRLRTVYDARCRVGRPGKPTEIDRGVAVAVQSAPTAPAGERVLPAHTPSPAHRAGLRCIRRVGIDHVEPYRPSLILHEVLQLPPRPSMQPGTQALPSTDTLPEVSEILHHDGPGTRGTSLGDDGFAKDVVDVAHMTLLTPGGLPQPALGRATAVGLETVAAREVAILRWRSAPPSNIFPVLVAASTLSPTSTPSTVPAADVGGDSGTSSTK